MANERVIFIVSIAFLGLVAAFLFGHRSEKAPETKEQKVQVVEKPKEPDHEMLPLSSGKIAVPFQFPNKYSLSQFLSPGMMVDVIFTTKEDLGLGTISLVLLKNIRIVEMAKQGEDKNTSNNNPVEILIEMTPRESELFSYAQNSGNISLAITGITPSEGINPLAEKLLKSESDENFKSILVTHIIQNLFPGVNVKVTSISKGYIVEGLADPKAIDKILKTLNLLSSEGSKTVINLMEEKSFRPVREFRSLTPEKGKMAVPFPLQSKSIIIQSLRPGITVDIRYATNMDIGFGTESLTLLRNIRVLALKELEIKPPPPGSLTNANNEPPALEVFLELTPRQAEIFTYAIQTGSVALTLPDPEVTDRHRELVQMLLESESPSQFHSVIVTHMIRTLFPHTNVRVTESHEGYIVEGNVSDPQVGAKILEILARLVKAGDKGIVNMLEIDPQQVLIMVRVYEVKKDITSNLGVNWKALYTNGGTSAAIAAIYPSPTAGNPDYNFMVSGLNFGKWNFQALVDALEEDDYTKLLAEPNLTTVAGVTAHFFAGGEFPILVPQGGTLLGTVTIEYKKYGVQLDFTPSVDLNGLITLHVVPEVSNLDKTNSVIIQGYVIPALITRRVDTIVKLWPGQSYLIAGLFEDQFEDLNDNLFGLDRIPILGAFFSSMHMEDAQTELLVIVTPYLINNESDCVSDEGLENCCPYKQEGCYE